VHGVEIEFPHAANGSEAALVLQRVQHPFAACAVSARGPPA
jgi:hypothetical protein